MNETDEELFAKARTHMERYSAAASLDRRLWDATVRLALKGIQPEGEAIGMVLIPAEQDAEFKAVMPVVRWIVEDANYKAPEQIGTVAERWIERLRDATLKGK